MINVYIDHSSFVRTFFSHYINDIICKVELILIYELNAAENSVLISLALDKLF